MARNIESIVMVLGLIVCSVMVLQVSGQSSGCPAPANVTWCPLISVLTRTCNNNGGSPSPVVTMPTILQILAAPATALASIVGGLAAAVVKTLGNFLVGLGNALIAAVAAGTATTTVAPATAAPYQVVWRPLFTFG